MTVKVRLVLSSITGLCFGVPVGWAVRWAVPGSVWGIVMALVACRLMEPLTQPELPLGERNRS